MGGLFHCFADKRPNLFYDDSKAHLFQGGTKAVCVARCPFNRPVVLLRGGNQPLDSAGERRKSGRNLRHFVCKGLHGLGQLLHLVRKLPNIHLSKFLGNLWQFGKLVRIGCKMGRLQRREASQTACNVPDLVCIGLLNAIQGGFKGRDVFWNCRGDFRRRVDFQVIYRSGKRFQFVSNSGRFDVFQRLPQLGDAVSDFG